MQEERELITQAQSGNVNAFRDLVESYKKRIFFLAYDLTGNFHDAEDLSQEVFIKMFHSLKKFRGEAKLSTWLYRITINTWIDTKRTSNFKLRELEEPLEEKTLEHLHISNESDDYPDKCAEMSLLQKHVQHSLQSLSPRERSVFVLRHYHDMRITEIGETLHISVGSVKSHLFRAVKKLQKSLAFYNQDNKKRKSHERL